MITDLYHFEVAVGGLDLAWIKNGNVIDHIVIVQSSGHPEREGGLLRFSRPGLHLANDGKHCIDWTGRFDGSNARGLIRE